MIDYYNYFVDNKVNRVNKNFDAMDSYSNSHIDFNHDNCFSIMAYIMDFRVSCCLVAAINYLYVNGLHYFHQNLDNQLYRNYS